MRDWKGISIDNLVIAFLGPLTLGRPAINKTGITGQFDIHLDLWSDPGSDTPNVRASIPAALKQQLGLELVPAKGPGEFLIIDHVERPSEN